jgi:hypothetical protein
MSEKLLALLFRLYPPAFRQRYLHEAVLLCRDRRRHETGFYRSARLARDLLVDFLAGLPKAWQTSYSVASDGSQAPNAQPVPSFSLLHAEPLSPTSVLLGCFFSVAAVTVFTLVMRATVLHPAEQHAFSPIKSVLQRLNQPPLPPPQKGDRQEAARVAPASVGIQQAVGLEGHPFSDSEDRGESPQNLPVRDQKSARLLASTIRSNGQRGHMSVGRLSIKSAARNLATFGSGVLAAPGAAIGAGSQGQVEPQDATQAMIQAISSHQIVMFGETHGNKQEYEWLCRLVKTPAFADRVDDIVVEFGSSLYQKTVDRYIAGENIPQTQIEKAWRNVIGAVGPVSPVYGWFYRAVRDSNLERHDGHKIRLLLGDPYVDWSKINNAEDLGPYLGHREQWYAEVVKEDVLAHHHRALLIMGAGHFVRRNGPGLVETVIRAAGVRPYLVVFGTNAVGRYDDLDHRFDTWPLPAIVPLSGNWVGELPANPVLTGGEVAPNSQKMADVADAMLYVGSRDTLTQVFVPRSELVDTAYGKEIERRLEIQIGRTMDFTQASEGPQYQKPLHQIVSNGIHRLPPNPPKSINDPLPPRPPSQ